MGFGPRQQPETGSGVVIKELSRGKFSVRGQYCSTAFIVQPRLSEAS
jgi:hypothetical protein